MRDSVVDFVNGVIKVFDITLEKILSWLEIYPNKFRNWQQRYGKVNFHNAQVPRDFWLDDWEREAILEYHSRHPLEGYRRLAFMMIDANVVAVSPSSVYRVLRDGGVLGKSNVTPSKKGTGFVQPTAPHEHWHVDVAHINIAGTFYYLCMVLDGFSRYLVSWDLRQQMTQIDIQQIIEKGKEKFPGVTPRIISDNGPQFLSKDFKEYVRIASMTHVKTSPFYPQSNGKLEAANKTVKREVIRPARPQTVDEARKLLTKFEQHYNCVRLHSSIDYVTPEAKLNGKATEVLALRDQRLEDARAKREAKARGNKLEKATKNFATKSEGENYVN